MKDYTRDYATEAFRFYAKVGKPSFEKLKQQIYDQALELSKREGIKTNNICSPTELSVMKAEQAVLEKKAELEDILAVEKTLHKIKGLQGKEVKKAVELVYFIEADKELKKGDIEKRVINASLELNADRSTIYRWLGIARKVFCHERGLRVTDKQVARL